MTGPDPWDDAVELRLFRGKEDQALDGLANFLIDAWLRLGCQSEDIRVHPEQVEDGRPPVPDPNHSKPE